MFDKIFAGAVIGLLVAAAVVAGASCGAPISELRPDKVGPGSEYPCAYYDDAGTLYGINAVECSPRPISCCDEGEACGGQPFSGCQAGDCCAAGEGDLLGARRVKPQWSPAHHP
jgi:hypothetical protein